MAGYREVFDQYGNRQLIYDAPLSADPFEELWPQAVQPTANTNILTQAIPTVVQNSFANQPTTQTYTPGDPSTYTPITQSTAQITANPGHGSLPPARIDPSTGYVQPTGPTAPTNQAYANMQDYLSAMNEYGVNSSPSAVSTTFQNSPSGSTGNTTFPEFDEWMSMFEGLPELGQIDLPQTPMISQTFSPEFDQQWQGFTSQNANDLAKFYEWGNWPTAQASLMDRSQIPTTTAETPQGFAALDFLLSGQGFDPATMAKMRATATDDIAGAGRSQRGSARLMAEQSGLSGSPAAMALEDQANRRQGQETSRALNQLDIANAQTGMENRRLGAGLELNRQSTGAEMANQAALANAARIFSGMQQNVANQQQTNLTNTQNQQQREMARAGTQAGFQANAATNYTNALLGKATEADTMNAANQINRGLNQAQLDRQRGMFNIGNRYGLYNNAMSILGGLTSGANPQGYYSGGASLGSQYSPNMIPAQTLSNTANTFRDATMRREI